MASSGKRRRLRTDRLSTCRNLVPLQTNLPFFATETNLRVSSSLVVLWYSAFPRHGIRNSLNTRPRRKRETLAREPGAFQGVARANERHEPTHAIQNRTRSIRRQAIRVATAGRRVMRRAGRPAVVALQRQWCQPARSVVVGQVPWRYAIMSLAACSSSASSCSASARVGRLANR